MWGKKSPIPDTCIVFVFYNLKLRLALYIQQKPTILKNNNKPNANYNQLVPQL